MSYKEPRKFRETKTFGDLSILFEGEQYPGNDILDTKVSINGVQLCWITWSEKDEFMQKLNHIISEYRI